MIFIERIKSLIVVLTASFYQIKLLDYSVGDTIIFGAEFYKRGTANLTYRSLCKFCFVYSVKPVAYYRTLYLNIYTY